MSTSLEAKYAFLREMMRSVYVASGGSLRECGKGVSRMFTSSLGLARGVDGWMGREGLLCLLLSELTDGVGCWTSLDFTSQLQRTQLPSHRSIHRQVEQIKHKIIRSPDFLVL